MQSKLSTQDKLIILQDVKNKVEFVLSRCSTPEEIEYAKSIIREYLAFLT
jgi:hypothetical protein